MGTAYIYLDDGNDDGTIFGQTSASKIGFYGTAPAAQDAFDNAAVETTLTTTNSSGTQWGFTSSAQPAALIALANELRAKLVALGLVATA